MADHRAWLVSNERSGSTTSEAVETLEQACSRHGLAIERSGVFPNDALPDAAALAGFDVLVVHGGDGTTNAAIRAAYGWDGAVLTLPGGTMNLIALRLHGEADAHTIVQRFCRRRGPAGAPADRAVRRGRCAGRSARRARHRLACRCARRCARPR